MTELLENKGNFDRLSYLENFSYLEKQSFGSCGNWARRSYVEWFKNDIMYYKSPNVLDFWR